VGNELVKLLDAESAKAIQETAKFGTGLVELVGDAGKAMGNVSGGIVKNSVGLIGDWVYHQRLRNFARLSERTLEILRKRGVKEPFLNVSPSAFVPIVDAAVNENSNELKELWARLLASAIDPSRRDSIRKSFIETIKQFDPIDARVFEKFGERVRWEPDTSAALSEILKISRDEVFVSIENLTRLNCLTRATVTEPQLTPFGSLLMSALRE
jgi:hypothetical protein